MYGTKRVFRLSPIRFQFNERKAVQAAGRLIAKGGGEMNYQALLKLLYLIDRTALIRYGRSVTGDRVVAMKDGPVLSRIYDRVGCHKQHLPDRAWHEFIPRPEPFVYTVRLAVDLGVSELSQVEVNLIDEIFDEHRDKDFRDLVEFTHTLPEWEDPGNTSKPIPFEIILRHAGVPKAQIREIAAEAEAESDLDQALASARG